MKKSAVMCLAFATAATLGLAGCSGEAPSQATEAPAVTTFQVDGYPLDRSLEGLAGMDSLQIVILSGVEQQKSVWNTEDGAAPELPAAENGELLSTDKAFTLVTPFSGTVTRTLQGDDLTNTKASILVTGGAVGDVSVEASGEVSPSIAEFAKSSQVLVAGEFDRTQPGVAINPHFAYRLEADGDTLTSLMESAGEERLPVFSLKELTAKIAAR